MTAESLKPIGIVIVRDTNPDGDRRKVFLRWDPQALMIYEGTHPIID